MMLPRSMISSSAAKDGSQLLQNAFKGKRQPFQCQPKVSSRTCRTASRHMSVRAMAAGKKEILILGGTRFIGVYLARQLIEHGHSVTLLTRGKKEIAYQIPDDTDESFAHYKESIKHIASDRKDKAMLEEKLSGKKFDVLYDLNGREADEADLILGALGGNIDQYIFCSSAGVYLKSIQMPHYESDAGDPKSRHKGKLDTEDFLASKGVNYTSIRPVYIYGPLNYNPVEEWFFHRIKEGRPIPVPGSGQQVTQLGHVKDLGTAFVKCLGNDKAAQQIYNISGERYVTFDGIALACAEAAGAPEPELVHYNAKDYDFGGAKPFPLRDQHFFTSIFKAEQELDWRPEFGLLDGLRDSYEKDFGRGTFRKAADFTADDIILKA